MVIFKGLALLISIIAAMTASQAANPLDAIASQVDKQTNIAAQNLTEKAIEHISEGNLTKEHLQQEYNASKGEIQQKAQEIIKQQVNNTTEQIQRKAEEEINKQVNKSLPGFELVLAFIGIGLAAFILRRSP